jgi:hypothetical protein
MVRRLSIIAFPQYLKVEITFCLLFDLPEGNFRGFPESFGYIGRYLTDTSGRHAPEKAADLTLQRGFLEALRFKDEAEA